MQKLQGKQCKFSVLSLFRYSMPSSCRKCCFYSMLETGVWLCSRIMKKWQGFSMEQTQYILVSFWWPELIVQQRYLPLIYIIETTCTKQLLFLCFSHFMWIVWLVWDWKLNLIVPYDFSGSADKCQALWQVLHQSLSNALLGISQKVRWWQLGS